MTTSTAILADLNTAISTGPSATSTANAIAAAGPIMDLLGNLELARTKAKELKSLLTSIIAVLDSGDGIKTGITNVRDTFV